MDYGVVNHGEHGGHGEEGQVGALRPALLALVAFCLGMAVDMREGMYCRQAMWWLTGAVGACVAGMIRRRGRTSGADALVGTALTLPSPRVPGEGIDMAVPVRAPAPQRLGRALTLILAAALAVQFVQLYRHYPGSLWNTPPGDARHQLSELKDHFTWITDPAERATAGAEIRGRELALMERVNPTFQVGLLVAAGLIVAAAMAWRQAGTGSKLPMAPVVGRAAVPLILLAHFALGAWLLHRSQSPYIDVYVFQQEGAEALLHGRNPYAERFTNIYGGNAAVYAEGLRKRDVVNFGFPYPPLSLFMAVPGYIVAGDVRYAHLLALTLTGALLFYARPSAMSLLAAMLLLFSPRVFMVAEMAWTEPFVILLLAATVFCAMRAPRLMPYALGLLLASKQYMVLAVPVAALLLPRPFRWRDYLLLMLKAAAVAAVVSLPLALWNVREFIHSAVTLQFKQPFREDSLSYLALVNYRAYWLMGKLRPLAAVHPGLTAWVAVPAFAAAAGGIVLALKRLPAGAGGFAWGLGVVYLLFLAVNKQAFCNYYLFVIACFCAAASIGSGESEPARGRDREPVVEDANAIRSGP